MLSREMAHTDGAGRLPRLIKLRLIASIHFSQSFKKQNLDRCILAGAELPRPTPKHWQPLQRGDRESTAG